MKYTRFLLILTPLIGCPTGPCEQESIEFTDVDTRPQVTSYENDGWDCDLLYARPDPIFGIAVVRGWKCTRCK